MSKKLTFLIALVLIFGCSMLDKDKDEHDPPPPPNLVPAVYDFDINGTGTAFFDGEAKKVSVAAMSEKITGKITVYYEGEDYPKVDVPPTDFGEYTVTFDVEASPGVDSAAGLPAGTLVIADGTPAAPSISSVKLKSASSIDIAWNGADRATSYKVYYITENMAEIKFIEEVSGTSFTHDGLTEGNTYYYFIISVNKYGESAYSDFKAIKIATPPSPINLEATAAGSNKINLRWGSVSGATSYEVYYTTDPDGEDKALLTTVTSNSASATNLSASTTFYFYVTAVNAVGKSDLSEQAYAKTFSAPNKDLGLAAQMGGVAGTSFSWIRVSVTKFSITRDQDLIILYTTDSPDNRKKFYNYLTYTQLSIGWYYVDDYDFLPNTTYYFWLTKDHYADNYTFDLNTGYENCNSLTTEYCESPYGYSEVAIIRTGDPPPPPSPTPTPSTPSTPPSSAGTGAKICTTCGGNGKCHRTYDIAFGSCSGGYVQCNTCSGKGTYNNKTCTTCKGAKKVKCGLCNGTGKCNRCSGTGKI